MFRYIKPLVEAGLNCRIYRQSLPRGTDLFYDLARSFGIGSFKVVFDVGANVGQTAIEYVHQFPSAKIYSFEPVPATYRELVAQTKHLPRVSAYDIAMGDEIKQAEIYLHEDSRMNSLNESLSKGRKETVKVDTLTHFCDSNQISSIDFLKLDTEGFELQVLGGARPMLEGGRVGLLQIESAPSAAEARFVSFAACVDYLYPLGFELFGIYDQQPYWDGRKSVQYFNLVFASKHILDREA